MSVTVEKCLQAWTNSLKQMNAKADIVFFGDSLTYYGDFSSVFPDKVVCNLGLRGDTIQGMINRVEQVKILAPKTIFLMAGINDVTLYTQKEFGRKYDVLIQTIFELLPKTELIIQSLLPVNNVEFQIGCNNCQIIQCNKEIQKLVEQYRLIFIDLFSIYNLNGLSKNETLDGIHLLNHGYRKWFNLLSEKYYLLCKMH